MQLPRPWLALAAAAAALVLAACGPSSHHVQSARAARYQAGPNELFRAVVDAVTDKHKVAQADAATGMLATEPRWYEVDGTYEDKSADGVMIENGSILLGFEVKLTGEGGIYGVAVTALAMQVRDGNAQPHPMNAQDPAMTGWISGKTDDLVLAIHAKLKAFEIKPGA